jgi:hypothetical protein
MVSSVSRKVFSPAANAARTAEVTLICLWLSSVPYTAEMMVSSIGRSEVLFVILMALSSLACALLISASVEIIAEA